jgi:hypothetical protein
VREREGGRARARERGMFEGRKRRSEEERKSGRDGVREPILIQGGRKREGPDRGKADVVLMCC